MAARKKKGIGEVGLTDTWKARIQVTVLATRLYKHAQGEIEMTQTQIKAAEILLRKMVPDLARTELSGPDGEAIPVGVKVSFV